MQKLSSALSAAALLLALSGPASAASPKVGEAAPELGAATWVMNPPEEESIAKLRGEVIFVEKWGVRCPPLLVRSCGLLVGTCGRPHSCTGASVVR